MNTKIYKMKAPENAYTMKTKASDVRATSGAWELGELVSFVTNKYSKEWTGHYYVTVDPLSIPTAVKADFYGILDMVLQWPDCVVWAGLNPTTHDIVISGSKLDK